MHFRAEVLIPPEVEEHILNEVLTEILMDFDEQGSDEEGNPNRHAFWDYWQIGGRFSGDKFRFSLDSDKFNAFFAELIKRNITVSGVQMGKQSLQPKSQIAAVDSLWRDYFPGTTEQCPVFDHYKEQPGDNLPRDICKLSAVPKDYTTFRLIIGRWKEWRKGYGARDMLTREIWNGATWQDTAWDGHLRRGIAQTEKHLKQEFRVTDDWWSITIDYHS